jgi:hypothetical protein
LTEEQEKAKLDADVTKLEAKANINKGEAKVALLKKKLAKDPEDKDV